MGELNFFAARNVLGDGCSGDAGIASLSQPGTVPTVRVMVSNSPYTFWYFWP